MASISAKIGKLLQGHTPQSSNQLQNTSQAQWSNQYFPQTTTTTTLVGQTISQAASTLYGTLYSTPWNTGLAGTNTYSTYIPFGQDHEKILKGIVSKSTPIRLLDRSIKHIRAAKVTLEDIEWLRSNVSALGYESMMYAMDVDEGVPFVGIMIPRDKISRNRYDYFLCIPITKERNGILDTAWPTFFESVLESSEE